jgi:hypothetical protein
MEKKKASPIVIAVMIGVVLILAGFTGKHLMDSFAPSRSEQSAEQLKRDLEQLRKDRK